ncbi:MAG: hypothetical protein AAGC60_04455 [Acidobacteriota bacterium]
MATPRSFDRRSTSSPRLRRLGSVSLLPTVALTCAVGLATVHTAVAEPAGLLESLDSSWIENSAWYQGDAEINLYDGTLVIYGEPRAAERIVHIFVTEAHDPDLLVKADDWRRDDAVGMLKLNYVTEAQTGVYYYNQMFSFFFERAAMNLAKMTLASHEWCGNTFKELVNFRHADGSAWHEYEFNTYWDGEGDGSFDVSFPDDLVVYESLPGQLRPLRFAEGLEVRFPLLGRQLSSRVKPPTPQPATLRVASRGAVEVPAGRFDAWTLELEHEGGVDTLVFEAAFPNRMLRWQQAGGDRFVLRHSDRMAYWQKNATGDEDLLE